MVDVHEQRVALSRLEDVEAEQHVLIQIEGTDQRVGVDIPLYDLHLHLAVADVLIHLSVVVQGEGSLHIGVRTDHRPDGFT